MRRVLALVRWAEGAVYGRQTARTQVPSSLDDSSSRAPIDSARSVMMPSHAFLRAVLAKVDPSRVRRTPTRHPRPDGSPGSRRRMAPSAAAMIRFGTVQGPSGEMHQQEDDAAEQAEASPLATLDHHQPDVT